MKRKTTNYYLCFFLGGEGVPPPKHKGVEGVN